MSEYSNSITIAVPAAYIEQANHIACLMGESAADINTFKIAGYTDGSSDYSVIHTVVKPSFVGALATLNLPPDPAYAPPEYDRSKAEQARDLIASGVILVASNADPHEQLAAWGLTAKESEL